VIITLGRIGPNAKSAVPQLLNYLENPDSFIRAATARALGGIGPDAKEAVPALKALLEDEDKSARVWAAFALARISGDTERKIRYLIKLWKDDREYPPRPFASVQFEVAQALELLGRDARPARDI